MVVWPVIRFITIIIIIINQLLIILFITIKPTLIFLEYSKQEAIGSKI